MDEFTIVPGRQRHNLDKLIKQRKKRTCAKSNEGQKSRKRKKDDSTTSTSLTSAIREGANSGGYSNSKTVTFADDTDLTSQQEETSHASLTQD